MNSAPAATYLTLAFRHVRQPGWPEDMGTCLQHAIHGPLIRGMAWRLQRKAQATPRIPDAARWTFDARAAAACNNA